MFDACALGFSFDQTFIYNRTLIYKIMGKKGKFYGGRVLGSSSTYYCLYLPDYYSADKKGYVAEHRYFYEQYHKCCVLPGVDIYHVDGNKQNNMIWNLGILPNADFASLLFKK